MDQSAPTLAAASALLLGIALLSHRDRIAIDRIAALQGASPTGRSLAWRTLGRVGRTRWARWGDSTELRRRLDLARDPWPLDHVLGAKVGLIVLGVALGVPLAIAFLPAVLLIPLVCFASSRLPDLFIARRLARRRAEIQRRTPALAELLVIALEGGLSTPLAFRRAAELLEGPLGVEARMAVRRMDLGLPWEAAVAEWVERSDTPGLRRLGRVLGRSQRLGGSIAPWLRRIAEDLRHEQRSRVEEQARGAPVKMLFPLVFLILPAFLLLTVGPVLLATLRSLR